MNEKTNFSLLSSSEMINLTPLLHNIRDLPNRECVMAQLRRRVFAPMVAFLVVAFAPTTARADFQIFSNPAPITIPAAGNGVPYPVPISVSGVTGSIVDMSFTINGLSHAFLDDMGMLLVAPNGTSGMIIFDGGVNGNVSGLTLTFADSNSFHSPAAWPLGAGPLVSGTYSPTSEYSGDTWPASAPLIAGVNPSVAADPTINSNFVFANAFAGVNPNGTWNLYIRDFVGGSAGSISGGVSINIASTPVPPTFLAMGIGMAGLAAVRRFRRA